MSDIDTRLRSLARRAPRRSVSATFTDSIMDRVEEQPRSLRMLWVQASKLQGRTSMKKVFMKPMGVAAGLVLAIALTGCTYAALHWNGFDNGANYGGVTTLADGTTRFWIHNNDCSDHQGKRYYDIKAGAHITPSELTDMLAGTCEYTDPSALFPGIPLGGTMPAGMNYWQAMQSTQEMQQYYVTQGTVKAIAGNALRVELSQRDGKHVVELPVLQTAKAFDKDKAITMNDLQPGDPVMVVLTLNAPFSTIQHFTDQWQDAGHGTIPGSSVYGIIKLHHAVYDVSGEGKEFTRLIPNVTDLQGMSPAEAGAYAQDPVHLHEETPLR